MKRAVLTLIKSGKKVQRVIFEKENDIIGWRVVHHDHNAYLPFYYFDLPQLMKAKLLDEGYEWYWSQDS